MAGVKGKSGGRRVGAGRKPKTADSKALQTSDPVEFLTALMRDVSVSVSDRKDAAKALLKAGVNGKKAKKDADARKVAGNRFAPAAPPRLAAVGGKRV